MVLRLTLLIAICGAVLIGVFAFDQPALKMEDFWHKKGVSAMATRDQLYRGCGYYDPSQLDDRAAGELNATLHSQWMAAYANAERCMIDHGFRYSDTLGGRAIGKCDQARFKAFPSCRSFAEGAHF
jgi:hypothetical protein